MIERHCNTNKHKVIKGLGTIFAAGKKSKCNVPIYEIFYYAKSNYK